MIVYHFISNLYPSYSFSHLKISQDLIVQQSLNLDVNLIFVRGNGVKFLLWPIGLTRRSIGRQPNLAMKMDTVLFCGVWGGVGEAPSNIGFGRVGPTRLDVVAEDSDIVA